MCLETLSYEEMAVKMHQREAVSWGQVSCSWPMEPHTIWTVRKINVIETHASIWKKMWLAKQSSALGCWDSDKWNVGWSPIYFILKVFANAGTVLVVLECHADSSIEIPFHVLQVPSDLNYTVFYLSHCNDPIRRLSESE